MAMYAKMIYEISSEVAQDAMIDEVLLPGAQPSDIAQVRTDRLEPDLCINIPYRSRDLPGPLTKPFA
jgi:hypothetical protein